MAKTWGYLVGGGTIEMASQKPYIILEKHLALVQIAKSVSWRSSHRCVWKGRSASLANFFGTFALPPGRGGSKILSVVGTTT